MSTELEYVGFWKRVVAALVDSVLMMLIVGPILYSIYGREYFQSEKFIQGPADFVLSYLVPAIAVIAFWSAKQSTPGKMVYRAKIVDSRTGEAPSTIQYLIRYIGYYVSIIPFCLGLLWVAWDPRKQGWHDKLAGTVVVKPKGSNNVEVEFADAGKTPT